ncbi:hypothetical protein L5515_010320 [Caenorhabditis briggsae]|uniref:Uncharacterized protein n=1 Tax=Caenorhabditis briggsae TaxID=6238 RepID=A0AAE9ELS6_CAEBR|nr:hypothetical protein L5515_010320 [Caenorhabditis briggsae]
MSDYKTFESFLRRYFDSGRSCVQARDNWIKKMKDIEASQPGTSRQSENRKVSESSESSGFSACSGFPARRDSYEEYEEPVVNRFDDEFEQPDPQISASNSIIIPNNTDPTESEIDEIEVKKKKKNQKKKKNKNKKKKKVEKEDEGMDFDPYAVPLQNIIRIFEKFAKQEFAQIRSRVHSGNKRVNIENDILRLLYLRRISYKCRTLADRFEIANKCLDFTIGLNKINIKLRTKSLDYCSRTLGDQFVCEIQDGTLMTKSY